MTLWRWFFVALALWALWHHWSNRSIEHPPGRLVLTKPVQTSPAERVIYHSGKYDLEALADFDIEARVLGKEIYHFDRVSDLSPVDLALGWGPMSDTAVLDNISIHQGNRGAWLRWKVNPTISAEALQHNFTNAHLIPTTPSMKAQMKAVRPGQIVHIRGQLIEARTPGLGNWRSSLTRTDTGLHACEIIRVEVFEVR